MRELDAWAEAGGKDDGDRITAVDRIKEWLKNGQEDQTLDLSGLRLSTLPPMPEGLQSLDASDNFLISLPANLPRSLKILNVARNWLSVLPETLPELKSLDLSHNWFSELPETLPDSLEVIIVNYNELRRLPKKLPALLKHLNVSLNHLEALSYLPPLLEVLIAYDNDLSELPELLPPLLKEIDVSKNNLANLRPLPASVRVIRAYFNFLDSLPALPDSVVLINVHHNRLTSLPEHVPASVREFNIANNRFTGLPSDFATRFPPTCVLNIQNNPFPDRVRTSLQHATSVEGYNGPRILFSMSDGGEDDAPPRPLKEAISEWYENGEQESAMDTWSAFEAEPCAPEFSKFLDGLGQTVSHVAPEFKAGVREELAQIAARAALRAKCFLVSYGATESCEDAVSYTRNAISRLIVEQDILDGVYDERLPELLPLMRASYRADKLRTIAEQKMESLPYVDETGVHLAYQVKLLERLGLRLKTTDMRFFNVYGVTEQDLDYAEMQVRNAEDEEFAVSLSTSDAWKSVLARQNPEEYAEAENRLIDAFTDIEAIEKRVDDLRRENDVAPDDKDSLKRLRKQVADGIAHEIIGPLTTKLLDEKGLAHLLDSPWPS